MKKTWMSFSYEPARKILFFEQNNVTANFDGRRSFALKKLCKKKIFWTGVEKVLFIIKGKQ